MPAYYIRLGVSHQPPGDKNCAEYDSFLPPGSIVEYRGEGKAMMCKMYHHLGV